jgi:GNAT superfamily N-acetyltransferase
MLLKMVQVLSMPACASDLDSLASLLLDAIDSGASVSFMASLDRRTAKDWWESTLDGLGPRGVAVVARDDDGVIIGCVLLQPAWAPNQPHRADVAKLLVHRRARRRGLARALMAELERAAWRAGFTLLTLDTKRGDAAEALYRSIGWTPVGTIPDYALNPDGTPCDTVVFFKAAWPSATQLDDLVHRFQECQVDKTEWTHAAHLCVGTWHVAHFGEAEALDRLRSGIQRLNISLGGTNTDTAGYHETITRAYVRLLGDYLQRYPQAKVVTAVQRLLAGPLAANDVLLQFYSEERLTSVAARLGPVEPDLRPISAEITERFLSGGASTRA